MSGRRCRLATLVWALASLIGCTERPIPVGAVLPLTGEHAAYGASLRRGIEVAEAEVNRTGGVTGRKVQVLYRDTRSSPQEAGALFRSLVQRELVPAVLGGATSAETLAMAPIAESYHRVLLSPSASSPLLSEAGEYTFRVWPSDLFEAAAAADFAAYTLRATRVLVISSEGPYAEGVREAFSARFSGPGRSVRTLIVRDAARRDADFLSQVRADLSRVHCLYLVGYSSGVIANLAAVRKAGFTLPALTVSAVAGADFRPARRDAEGLILPRPHFEASAPETAGVRFATAYRKRFGSDPDVFAAHGYDALAVLTSVMATQGVRPESLQRGLLAVRNFPGACGPTTFDAKGDVVQPIQVCVVRAGAVVPLSEVQEEILPALQSEVEILRFGRKSPDTVTGR